MDFFEKNVFKIVIIFVLLSSGALCTYTVLNYNKTASTQTTENTQGFQNKSDRQRPDNAGGIKPGQSTNTNTSTNSSTSTSMSTAQRAMTQGGNFNMRNSTSSASVAYSPLFIVYAAAFFGMLALAYYYLVRKKLKINISNIKLLIFTLLTVGLLLRITLALLIQGYPGDISLFKNWATSVASNFSQFYSGSRSSDYPPFYIYVLYVIGKIGSISIFSKFYILLLKLPSILADIAVSYFLYRIAKKYLSLEFSILISAFYIFNPAIFINSTLWGQVDSFFTLIVVISVFLLTENRLCLSAVMFTVAVLMKPQGIIFLPVLFFELVRQKNIKNFIKVFVVVLITAAVIILPFAYNKEALWIFKLYSSTVSEYPYASLNAYNFFSLIGANYAKDSSTLFFISYKAIGMIFIVLTTLFSWYLYIKADDSKFAPAAALIQIAGVFTFSVGMHERYLFPAVALSALTFIYLRDKRILLLMLGYSYTSYINVHTILFRTLKGTMSSSTYDPTLFVTSLINVILFIYLSKIMTDIMVKRKKLCIE